MPHALMHSKSIFLGACIITKVAFQHHFLQLFVIYIEVRSQSTHFGKFILASVTFLLSSFMSVYSLLFLCISFRTFLFTLFIIFVFTLGTLLLVLALNPQLYGCSRQCSRPVLVQYSMGFSPNPLINGLIQHTFKLNIFFLKKNSQ